MSKGQGREKMMARQQRRLMERNKGRHAASDGGASSLTLLALHMDRLGLMQVEFTRHELEAGGVPGKSVIVEGDQEILRIRLIPTSVFDEMQAGKLPTQREEVAHGDEADQEPPAGQAPGGAG